MDKRSFGVDSDPSSPSQNDASKEEDGTGGPNPGLAARNPYATGPFDDPIEAFQRRTSPTPVLLLQLGVTMNLTDPYYQMQ